MTALPRRAALAAAAVLVLLAGAPTLATTPAGSTAPATTTSTSGLPAGYLPVASWMLLAKVNDHRRARGLVALKVDPGLAATARAWSEAMARRGAVAHNDAMFSRTSRQRLGMRMLGENVGWNHTVLAQHTAFLASAGHRRNIELAGFRVAGFAVVRDGRGRLWATEAFGTRSA